MKALLRLYPARWLDRYRGEMEALLDDIPPSPRVALDLMKGALMAHLDGEQAQSETVLVGAPTTAEEQPGARSRRRSHWLLFALPFLVIASVLLVMAGAQLYFILDGVVRFGWLEVPIHSPMVTRTLLYAVPGSVAGIVAVVILRRR
ncbi:MAG: hypothetical protein M3395_00450 [Chloroflexota bacterium]|nr:hypothetical protein [Chloroflexota bacterium]